MWYIIPLALLSCTSTVWAEPVCYDNSGNQNPASFPCDPSASGASLCCGAGQTCYSNSLCRNPDDGLTKYVAGDCTNPKISNTTTPGCAAQAQCVQAGGVGVTDCGASVYCCYGLDGCACDNANVTFTLASGGTIVTTIPNVTTTSTSSLASSFNTATATSLTSSTSLSFTSPSLIPTTAAASSPLSDNSKIGLGVGVGLGGLLVIIVAAFLFVFFRRKRSRAVKSSLDPHETSVHTHMTTNQSTYQPIATQEQDDATARRAISRPQLATTEYQSHAPAQLVQLDDTARARHPPTELPAERWK